MVISNFKKVDYTNCTVFFLFFFLSGWLLCRTQQRSYLALRIREGCKGRRTETNKTGVFDLCCGSNQLQAASRLYTPLPVNSQRVIQPRRIQRQGVKYFLLSPARDLSHELIFLWTSLFHPLFLLGPSSSLSICNIPLFRLLPLLH